MQMMNAIRGNSPNQIAFSNFIFRVSKFSESHQFNGYGSLNLMRIRLFSSIDGHNRDEEGIENGRNDSDSEVSEGNSENFGNQGFKPSIHELLNWPLPEEKRRGTDHDDMGKAETSCNEVNSTARPTRNVRPPDADKIFNTMKQSKLIPNAVAMIDGLCKDGLIHEALKIFGMMRQKGSMPEVIVYTSVVEGFCQAQKIDDAVRVFKKMIDNRILPNAYSYTVLIKGLCKATRLEEATDLCVEMVEAGHSPNVPLFTGLVEELCKEKGLQDAKKFILTLRQKGFFLDERAVRVYYDKTGPTSSMVWEAIFGPKKIYKP